MAPRPTEVFRTKRLYSQLSHFKLKIDHSVLELELAPMYYKTEPIISPVNTRRSPLILSLHISLGPSHATRASALSA